MDIRNVAIIAHVDHGKTTIVDGMLRQSQVFRDNQQLTDRVMDSGSIERERGITILAKNTAIEYGNVKINIVDTPGHADFGGEVERALGMVNGVLLLVDAAEGPMPQTRFVLGKALARGLKPIVVVNKIDRRDARPDTVIDLTFDLMVELGADDEQLDFPILYAIAREGRAWTDLDSPGDDLKPLFDAIISHIPAPAVEADGPFMMQVANLDGSDYLGRIAVGRIERGSVSPGDQVVRVAADDSKQRARITKVYTHMGLARVETDRGVAGDIIALTGLDDVTIGDAITHPDHPVQPERVPVDEPTVQVTFSPNTSPFAGQDGRYLTRRQLGDRLKRHLASLLEPRRRAGFVFPVPRPEVISRAIGGVQHDPSERVIAGAPVNAVRAVMESLSSRRGTRENMDQGEERARLEILMP